MSYILPPTDREELDLLRQDVDDLRAGVAQNTSSIIDLTFRLQQTADRVADTEANRDQIAGILNVMAEWLKVTQALTLRVGRIEEALRLEDAVVDPAHSE